METGKKKQFFASVMETGPRKDCPYVLSYRGGLLDISRLNGDKLNQCS